MATISLCMIVKDEEQVIGRCLDSVTGFIDEINIIDTGSTDSTKEIAAQYTERIFEFPWIDDFAAARNFSFKQATGDFILWLDADDVLLKEDQLKFTKLKEALETDEKLANINGFIMDYALCGVNNYEAELDIVRRLRLIRRETDVHWAGKVHEDLDLSGNVLVSNIKITHQPIERDDYDRNILIYQGLIDSGQELNPSDLYHYANELLDRKRCEEAIFYYNKFLEDTKDNPAYVRSQTIVLGNLYNCYMHLGDKDKAFSALTETFKFDSPIPSICCKMGVYFYDKEQYHTAIYWYKQALNFETNIADLYVNTLAFSTWMPHFHLSCCYQVLGEMDKAIEHIKIAYNLNPDHSKIKTVYDALIKNEQK